MKKQFNGPYKAATMWVPCIQQYMTETLKELARLTTSPI